jgi:hypothetical protein
MISNRIFWFVVFTVVCGREEHPCDTNGARHPKSPCTKNQDSIDNLRAQSSQEKNEWAFEKGQVSVDAQDAFRKGKSQLSRAVKNVQGWASSAVTAVGGTVSQVPSVFSKLGPQLKTLADTFKMNKKSAEKELKGLDKTMWNNLKADEKMWKQTYKRENKDAANFFKLLDKKVSATDKYILRKTATTGKKFDKKIKAVKKSVAKDEKKLDKIFLGQKKNVEKIQSQYEDTQAEATAISESLEKKTDKLIDSPDDSNPGLEIAQDRSMDLEDRTMDMGEKEIDELESQEFIKIAELESMLSGKSKEMQVRQAKKMMEADEKITGLAAEGERMLRGFATATGELQDDVKRQYRTIAKQEAKVTRQYESTKSNVENSNADVGSRLEEIGANIHDRINEYDDKTKDMLNEFTNKRVQETVGMEKTLLESVKKDVNEGLLAATAIATGSTATNFANDLSSTTSSLATEQNKIDAQSAQEARDNQKLATIEGGLTSMGDTVTQLPEVAQHLQEKTKVILDDLQKAAEKRLSGVKESEEDSTRFLEEQTMQVQALVGKMRDEFVELLREKQASVHDKLVGLEETSSNAVGSTSTTSRAVDAKVAEARATMQQVEEKMKKLLKAAVVQRQTTEKQLTIAEQKAERMQTKTQEEGARVTEDMQTASEYMIRKAAEQGEDDINKAVEEDNKAKSGVEAAIQEEQKKQLALSKQLAQKSDENEAKVHATNQSVIALTAQLDDDYATWDEAMKKTYSLLDAAKSEFHEKKDDLASKTKTLVDENVAQFRADSDAVIGKFQSAVGSKIKEANTAFQQEYSAAGETLRGTQAATKRLLNGAREQSAQVEKQAGNFEGWLHASAEKAGDAAVASAQKNLVAIQDEGVEVGRAAGQMQAEETKIRSTLLGEAQAARDSASLELSKAQTDAAAQAGAAVQEARRQVKGGENEAGTVQHDLAESGRLAEAEDQAVEHAIKKALPGVQQDLHQMEAEVNHEQGMVDEGRREEEAALAAVQLDRKRQADRAGHEETQLERDIQSEQGAVNAEVRDMVAALQPILMQLDPSGKLAAGVTSMEQLKGLLHHAQNVLGGKEGEFARAVLAAFNRGAEADRMTQEQEAAFSLKIVAAARELKDTMHQVHERYQETDKGVTQLVDGLSSVVDEGDKMLKKKFQKVLEQRNATQGKVENALELEKYQTDEGLKKVIAVLDESQGQTNKLVKTQTQVIMPSISSWRGEVEKVFSSMGMALDLERISRLAAESEAAEGDQGTILSAEQEMKHKVQKVAAELSGKTREIWAAANKRIAAIHALEHLTDEEKNAMIVKIRGDAQAAAGKLMEKARATMSKYNDVAIRIEKGMAELNGLLARAELLAKGHDGSAESHALLLKLVVDLKSQVAALRRAYTDAAHPAALLELDAASDGYIPDEVEPLYDKALQFLESAVPSVG